MPSLKEILASALTTLTEYLNADDEGNPLDAQDEKEKEKITRARAKEVANALRARENAKVNPISQLLLNAGAGRNKTEVEPRIKELSDEVERLTGELETAKTAVEAAKGEPEERYKILERKHDKLATDLAAATKALEDERTGRVGDKTELIVDKVRAKLDGKVDPDWLDEVIVPKIRKQIRAKPDKTIVLYPPGDEVPYDAATVEEAIPHLADDIFAAVDAKRRISRSEEGAGGAGDGRGLAGKVATPEENKKKLKRSGSY